MSTGYDLFISYRRADAGGHAGRLYDRLRHWFDDGVMFYDLDAIDMGDVFPENIETAINTALTVLVVIGPDWLAEINQRVDRPGIDFVRREIELALARSGHDNPPKIVPVLVGGATMPDQNQFHPSLQPSLAPLCRLDAHTFQGKQADWDQQFVRLRERLAQVPGMPEPRFHAPAGIEQPFHITGDSLSPHFQDPNNLLGQLRQQLTSAQRAALCGMGGMGKTQMALKYCLEYRDCYAGVWWFRAENDITLQLDGQTVCQTIGISPLSGETPTIALNRWLEQQEGTWLFVFDSATEPLTLRPHLPHSNKHHLIITSRNPAWAGLALPLELDTWSSRQGANFLTSRLPKQTHAALTLLTDDLGGLPLALEQAAAYIEETGCTVDEYRQLLHGVDTEALVLEEGRAATGYERTVAATLTLAFGQLSIAAQQLLRMCAYAAPELLPERFFKESQALLPDELAQALNTTLSWNKTVGELRKHGLAQRQILPTRDASNTAEQEEQALSVHRLVQQAIRAKYAIVPDDARAFLSLLEACCSGDVESPPYWPRYAALTPHVMQFLRLSQSIVLDASTIGWVLNQIAAYLQRGPALYAEAVHLLEHAATLLETTLGEQHPGTLATMHNLALTLLLMDRLPEARTVQEKVVATCRKYLGEKDPRTLAALSNLSGTLEKQGFLDDALRLSEQVLQGDLAEQGVEHLDIFRNINNLLQILKKKGYNLQHIRAIQEEVVNRISNTHPFALTCKFNLAGTLRELGELREARLLDEEVLNARLRSLGDEHPDTLASKNSLANTLRKSGELIGARTLQEAVLEARHRRLGASHSDTTISAWNLFDTLISLKDFEAAENLFATHLDRLLHTQTDKLTADQKIILQRLMTWSNERPDKNHSPNTSHSSPDTDE